MKHKIKITNGEIKYKVSVNSNSLCYSDTNATNALG